MKILTVGVQSLKDRMLNKKLILEWHPTKNGNLAPKDVSKNSTKKVWWICKNNHEWKAIIYSRNVSGCPYCSNKKVCKDNCLATTHPKLAREWNSKNILTPYDVVSGSNKKVWWICKNNHEWEAVINDRMCGNNCPYCSNKKVCEDNCLATINPELAKQWHPDKNGNLTPNDVVCKSGKKVWWICENHHKWKASISHRSNGRNCPYCSNKKVCKDNSLSTINPELSKQWHPTKNGNLTPKNFTSGSDKKVWWVCENNHEWKALIYKRNKNLGCPYCSNKKACEDNCLTTTNPELAKQWSSRNTLTPYDVLAGSDKKVWWVCENNHEWKASVSHRNNGRNCPYCSNKKVCEDNCLATINPELSKQWSSKNILTPNDVVFGSNKKVWWVCENNHEWKAQINRRNSGARCPKCSKNCISKISQAWLDEIGITNREKSIIIRGRKYIVDGIKNNVIYEFLGDFWHGNPNIFDPRKIHPIKNMLYLDILIKTAKRLNILNKKFIIIYKWESDKSRQYFPVNVKNIKKNALRIFKMDEYVDIFMERKWLK